MTVETYTLVDVTSKVSGEQLLKALGILYSDYFPKALPHYAQSYEILNAHPFAVGSVCKIIFPPGNPLKYAKNRTEEIDMDKLYVRYRCFEGGILGDKLNSIVFEHKAECLQSGCRYKIDVHFDCKDGFGMNEQELGMYRAKFKKNMEAVEEYLLANNPLLTT